MPGFVLAELVSIALDQPRDSRCSVRVRRVDRPAEVLLAVILVSEIPPVGDEPDGLAGDEWRCAPGAPQLGQALERSRIDRARAPRGRRHAAK